MFPINITALDAIIFDFDGVLTDNCVYVFEDGREVAKCHRGDGLSFEYIKKHNLPVYILSKEKNSVVTRRAEKLKIQVFSSVDNKGAALRDLAKEQDYNLKRLMFIGNDLNDLPALNMVGYPVAVADSHAKVQKAACYTLSTKGGLGIVREVTDDLLSFENEG